ncbi:MAG: pyruvate kinase [Verrucomicrobiota bacterium]
MRKTKIIATLGPAIESGEELKQLIQAGVSIFRLNMSHAKHEWVKDIVKQIRAQAAGLNQTVGILLDTQGPAIRTGDLPTNLDLKEGDTFTFTVRGHVSEEAYSVDTNYDDLVSDIKVGDVVMVDNGVIQMVVRDKNENELKCEVLTPGALGSRRHINLPGARVNLPALTEKDLADIQVGIECDVDLIALSFARESKDVLQLKELLKSKGAAHISVIAKIEDQSAVKEIEQIVEAADGIMVARGDLGVECPYEELPIIQRRIIKKCVASVKPVIVATHMLESMIEKPLPTRAEITDVANAVYEEADAIMLSGETAVGKYPVKCIQVLDRVAQRIERTGNIRYHEKVVLRDTRENVGASAVHLANEMKAEGLVVFTRSGRMARVCAGLRPEVTSIFAFTPDEQLTRRLSLYYGVIPLFLQFDEIPQKNLPEAEKLLLERKILPEGSKVVVLSELFVESKVIWSVQVRELGLNV